MYLKLKYVYKDICINETGNLVCCVKLIFQSLNFPFEYCMDADINQYTRILQTNQYTV